MMDNINMLDVGIWLGLAAAGFFTSIFFEAVRKRIQYFYINKTRDTAFDGTWFCYHATRKKREDGVVVVVVMKSCWDVSKSLTADFSVKTYKPGEDVAKSSYAGEGKKDEHSSVVISFSSPDGNSQSVFRVKFPFPGSEMVAGVWIGVDYTHTMIASTFVLTRKPQDIESEKELKELLVSQFKCIDGVCITQS